MVYGSHVIKLWLLLLLLFTPNGSPQLSKVGQRLLTQFVIYLDRPETWSSNYNKGEYKKQHTTLQVPKESGANATVAIAI